MLGTMDYSAAIGTTTGLEFFKTIGGLVSQSLSRWQQLVWQFIYAIIIYNTY